QIESTDRKMVLQLPQRIGDFPGLIKRHSGLEAGKASLLQCAANAGIKIVTEQGFARTDGIGPVRDDKVETAARFVAPQILKCVGDFDPEPPVAKGLSIHFGKMLAAEFNHFFVNIDEHYFL